MKLDIVPSPLAPVVAKQKWLMYEMIRFSHASNRLASARVITMIGVAVYLFFSCSLWVGLGLLLISMWFLDFVFRLLHAYFFADFYVDIAQVAYAADAGLEQDLRIMLNRVGNVFSNKDPLRREALDDQLRNTYTMVQTKFELREAIHEIDKRKAPPKP